MIQQGIFKKEYVVNVGSSFFIEALSQAVFNITDLNEYKGYFSSIAEQGSVAKGVFEDDKWEIYHNGKRRAIFRFNIDIYPELKLALKCFVVTGLYSRLNPPNLNLITNHIKEGIMQTQGFSGDDADSKLENWFMKKSKNVLLKIIPYVSQFINFCIKDEDESLNDVCRNFYPGFLQCIRTLPNFLDVLTFDYILDDFSKKWSDLERLTYYPILLWWKITMIVPMRTSEFCLLEYNCSFSKNDEFFLKIPRIKRKSKTTQNIDVTDTLQINKELYDLILAYKECIKRFKRTQYLLSYEAYMKAKGFQRNKQAFSAKANKDQFDPVQLYKLLHHFYEEIVTTKYGYTDLSRIRPMDTRHFAFCNMMLQGFNMLSIARIGGHYKLEAQMHYFQHLDHFNESSIQYLADQYKKLLLITQFPEHPMLTGKERILKAKSILKNEKYTNLDSSSRVEYGYCTFNPKHCPVGDCRYCEHLYIPQEELTTEVYKWLCDESDRLKARIKEQTELMCSISLNMNYNLVTFEYDPLSQAELNHLATNSKKLREQKAMTDAHRDIVENHLLEMKKNEK